MTEQLTPREIPFNYTSADDRQAIALLLGPAVWQRLEGLRTRRVTGRSARLLMRFFGEILIHRRNPFLFQELVDSKPRRRRFFENIEKDLGLVQRNANGEPRVLEVLGDCRALLETSGRTSRARRTCAGGSSASSARSSARTTSSSTRSRSCRTRPTRPTGGSTCPSRS